MLRSNQRVSFLRDFRSSTFLLYRTGSIRPQTSLAQSKPPEKSQAELEEEDALQLALSLSQSEADEKERQKKLLTQRYAQSTTAQYPSIPIGSAPVVDESYWETQTKNDLITIKPLTVVNEFFHPIVSFPSFFVLYRILVINLYVMMKSIHSSTLSMHTLIILNFGC